MNGESTLDPEVARLARSVRFAFVMLLVGLSYWTVAPFWGIEGMVHAWGGAAKTTGSGTPALVEFVIFSRYVLAIIGCLVPLLAVATLFTRRIVASFYILGGLCFVSFALLALLYYHAPFMLWYMSANSRR